MLATNGPQHLDTCRVYGITLTEQDAHGAEADALAAGRLAWAIAVRKPGLQMPAMELHAWQVEEKQRQAESFAAWREGRL